MKKFLENYGFIAIAAIVVVLLIGMATPVGAAIKNSVLGITNKFGDTTNSLVNGIDVDPYAKQEEEQADVEDKMPEKGDLISLNLGSTYGETEFRVVSIEGNIAKIVQMSNTESFGGDIENYLNTTYYNNLSDSIKNAIQLQTYEKSTYSSTDLTHNPSYIPQASEYVLYGTYSSTQGIPYYFTKTSYNSAQNNIYLLDLQDLADYLGKDNLSYDNLDNMLNIGFSSYVRAFSSISSSGNHYTIEQSGHIGANMPDNASSSARPAFTIDLSQITFTIN